MKEIIIATTSMFVISVSVPKDTLKPVSSQQKKISKKNEKKAGESEEAAFSLFNVTFKFQ